MWHALSLGVAIDIMARCRSLGCCFLLGTLDLGGVLSFLDTLSHFGLLVLIGKSLNDYSSMLAKASTAMVIASTATAIATISKRIRYSFMGCSFVRAR